MEKLTSFVKRHAGELIYLTVVIAIASLVLSFVARDTLIVMWLYQYGIVGLVLIGIGLIIAAVIYQLIQLVKLWKR